MQPSLTPKTKRIESIDLLRGLAMVLMALDHVRDYFHVGANMDDPLNLDTTSPALFFTRWITHFCAPIFIFLSGTSIYLQSLRKTKKELGIFLVKRGLWLIVVEWTIVAFAWTFNPRFNIIPLQVIWAIGVSMVVFGLLMLMRFSFTLIIITGVTLVFGHNLLDIPESAGGFTANFWWDLFHSGVFKSYTIAPGHNALLVYPFPAWTGLMMLGFSAGILYSPRFTAAQRKKMLVGAGVGLLLFFVILRFTNAYGDPVEWSRQKNGLYTFFSFIKVNKYPPSLLYLSLMIGPSLILLAFIESVHNGFNRMMIVFGRTAFFYYIIHIYLIHSLATICFFARGHSLADVAIVGEKYPFLFVVPGEGFRLWVVYGVWLAVIAALYPVCKWYDKLKTNHKEKWWLSYL